MKKIKENEELKEARRKQIEGQRECFANEIQREKEQFDKIIKLNVEDIEKTKEMERQAKMVCLTLLIGHHFYPQTYKRLILISRFH